MFALLNCGLLSQSVHLLAVWHQLLCYCPGINMHKGVFDQILYS